MYPQVHDTGIVLSLTHCVGNVTAALGVLHPELADRLVGVGQREAAALGVRERRRVEVEQGVVLLCPVNPALEIFDGHLVTVNHLALEIAVDFVQIQTVVARDKALGLQDVRTQFVNVAGRTGEVAGTLYAAAQCSGLNLETFYVIGLPAVQ